MLNAAFRFAYRCAHLLRRIWWFLRRPETHGSLVAIWHDGKILLLQTTYRRRYSLPGGHVRFYEDALRAAVRELHEETGISLAPTALRHAWHGTRDFEFRRDTIDIWEVTVDTPVELHANQREIGWLGWKTPDEARAMAIVPHLRDYLAERRAQR
jgi:8-oxo-dGTP pyrophosphatase MutT (NUDIX family)